MSVSLFSGCSLTSGFGFPLEKDDPALWVNLLHQSNSKLNKTQILNVGVAGSSNASIFRDTVFNLLTQPNIKYAFVEWTSVPRYELSLGLETYDTSQVFLPNNQPREHNLHNITYSKKYLKNINDRFTTLAHDHYEIVNLLHYINAITCLGKLKQCQVFYINGLCSWDENYFKKLHDVLPSDYTEYTKKQLHTSTRDDKEATELYNKIHHEYDIVGGIQEDAWLNLYASMISQRIDLNNDGAHPGINSNQKYCQQFIQALDSKLL